MTLQKNEKIVLDSFIMINGCGGTFIFISTVWGLTLYKATKGRWSSTSLAFNFLLICGYSFILQAKLRLEVGEVSVRYRE